MKIKFLLTLIIIFLLSSCSEKSAILQNDVCEKPCFLGIILGETDIDDTLDLIKSSNIIKPESIVENKDEKSTNSIEWVFQRHLREVTGIIYFSNQVAAQIYIRGKGLLTVEEMLKKYGEPDYLNPVFQWGDYPYADYSIIYIKKGIILSGTESRISLIEGKSYFELNINSTIDDFLLFDPVYLRDLIDHRKIFQNTWDCAQSWSGLGAIELCKW